MTANCNLSVWEVSRIYSTSVLSGRTRLKDRSGLCDSAGRKITQLPPSLQCNCCLWTAEVLMQTESGKESRLRFNFTGHFYGELGTIIIHVCGDKTRYFKSKHDLSLNLTVGFVPKPNWSVSTLLSQHHSQKLTWRNAQFQHLCLLQTKSHPHNIYGKSTSRSLKRKLWYLILSLSRSIFKMLLRRFQHI